MLASTTLQRVGNVGARVIPYAQWLPIVINLGYLGWNLFVLYRRYCEQYQEDQRRGYARTFEETMELIVRPRRTNTTADQMSPQPSESRNDSGRLHAEDKENERCVRDSHSNTPRQTDNCEPSTKANCIYPSLIELPEDDEVEVVYDSRAGNSRAIDGEQARVSADHNHLQIVEVNDDNLEVLSESKFNACINRNNTQNHDEQEDEVQSTTSTGLESTDSNKGIVHDIYTHCFVCTYPLNDTNKPVATLPFCLHPFHELCLKGVLQWHSKCPVCDTHILSPI